jgi:hypothetical protein
MGRIRTAYRSQDTDRILGAGLLFDTCVVVANFRGGCLSAQVEIMPGEWAEGAENDRWKLRRVRRVQCNLLERRMDVWLLCRVDGVSDEHASGITNHEKQVASYPGGASDHVSDLVTRLVGFAPLLYATSPISFDFAIVTSQHVSKMFRIKTGAMRVQMV